VVLIQGGIILPEGWLWARMHWLKRWTIM